MHSNKPTEVDSMNRLRVEAERKNRELRSALLWILWHHQGASSIAGLAARRALGMGQFDHLTDEQIADAKEWDAASAPPSDEPCGVTRWCMREDCRKCHPKASPRAVEGKTNG